MVTYFLLAIAFFIGFAMPYLIREPLQNMKHLFLFTVLTFGTQCFAGLVEEGNFIEVEFIILGCESIMV